MLTLKIPERSHNVSIVDFEHVTPFDHSSPVHHTIFERLHPNIFHVSMQYLSYTLAPLVELPNIFKAFQNGSEKLAFCYTGRGLLRTLPNIYDKAFLRN